MSLGLRDSDDMFIKEAFYCCGEFHLVLSVGTVGGLGQGGTTCGRTELRRAPISHSQQLGQYQPVRGTPSLPPVARKGRNIFVLAHRPLHLIPEPEAGRQAAAKEGLISSPPCFCLHRFPFPP